KRLWSGPLCARWGRTRHPRWTSSQGSISDCLEESLLAAWLHLCFNGKDREASTSRSLCVISPATRAPLWRGLAHAVEAYRRERTGIDELVIQSIAGHHFQ